VNHGQSVMETRSVEAGGGMVRRGEACKGGWHGEAGSGRRGMGQAR